MEGIVIDENKLNKFNENVKSTIKAKPELEDELGKTLEIIADTVNLIFEERKLVAVWENEFPILKVTNENNS